MIRLLILSLTMFTVFCANAQFKTIDKHGVPVTILNQPNPPKLGTSTPSINGSNYAPIGNLTKFSIQKPIRAQQYDHNKMPILIEGWLNNAPGNIERQALEYLSEIADLYAVKDPSSEWIVQSIDSDNIGMKHIRVQQQLSGIPIYNGELILHAKDGRIETVMGRGFPTPELATLTPGLSMVEAERQVKERLEKMDHYVKIPAVQREMLGLEQVELELVIYHEKEQANRERLVYKVLAYENLASFDTYFIDAHTAEVIEQHSNICKFHGDHLLPPDGPQKATATDLNGVNRTIDTYESAGNFYMINATKPNFSLSQSTMPDSPKGVIWTLNANNSSPSADDFEIFHVATSDNNSWTDRSSVSAHYNAAIAYDYFKDVHGRNAIDGSGGNVISFVNVTDEDDADMDNAFWNGTGMFYGNGNTDFFPLAGGLDVAGHEMSHGVVQSSANLTYQNESGALNESFADVFGVMMDRNDYAIGEDVVSNTFPSGALRDMADPNNGGTKLGDIGWQPKHVDEQYFGSQDNGGVHINSGIPNHAFYLFAETVGKDKAEKVYYRALTQYLTRSSRFVDARNAVVQSAQDLYGTAEADAAKNAFSQVGIGEGSGGDYTNDAQVNEGEEHLIYADEAQTKLAIVDSDLEAVLDPASVYPPISVPSVSDDGSLIFYVNSDNQIAFTTINWNTGDVGADLFSDQDIWSNVVVSKDGNRIAAVEVAQSNRIQVYDFNKNEWYKDAFGNFGFELYNPTFTEGVSTGDAKFADALEFDISGEILMYDVYSEIEGNFGQKIGYWDIGFLEVWDNSSANWGSGNIAKLFSSLDEGISVGNPTFSKNSPYIIAFDYIEGNEYSVIAANVETGDLGLIFENSSLGYPSYSGSDEQMVFTNQTTFESDIFIVNLQDSKILPQANTTGELISDAIWGVVFRNGTRILSDVEDVEVLQDQLDIFPNPASSMITIKTEIKQGGAYEIRLLDFEGKVLRSEEIKMHSGSNEQLVNVQALPAGNYTLQLVSENEIRVGSFSKI